ncbi:hypothetical protein [Campylobacter ureolyticus]|uniref:hypothetical protein n=1 Tax=Campylobacter ureolyticus TaxID=827 RepID=UPI002906B4CD|nr:hypothetical protein [Campylobacter ureolyticus]MDU5326168.1 hypothetical protein [Campylobacter ureolyticus]
MKKEQSFSLNNESLTNKTIGVISSAGLKPDENKALKEESKKRTSKESDDGSVQNKKN